MSNNAPYCNLFYVTLTQLTEFNTAGNDTDDIDITLAKNGQGEYIIRGSTLAGAIVHQAKKLGFSIPSNLAGDTWVDDADGKQQRISQPSCMRVFNARLVDQAQTSQFKQHVAINPKTGAAFDNALFDVEVLPRGNEWHVFIEVNESKTQEQSDSASQIIAHVLNYWQQNPLFLGHRPVAGYGWFNVANAEVVQLSTTHLFDYPNNSKNYPRDKQALLDDLSIQPYPISDFICTKKPTPKVSQIVYDITLSAGVNEDEHGEQWGLDSFFIGGHEIEAPLSFNKVDENIQKNLKSGSAYKYTEQDMPDNFFVVDHTNTPYIPSASIRGPLRHQLIRQGHEKLAEQLFGTTEHSSNCYIQQAYLSSESWQGMILHNHAEDEFTAGVYGSSKFVRMCVTQGTFSTRLIIEYLNDENGNMPKHIQQQINALEEVFELAKQKQLAIGAKQWVDSGWLKWEAKKVQGESHE
ncbi:RAMP superfamily CRISPR-associated protein [Pseudoalteromonas sp. T1lg65]|uniref:RAMP superfamily CRISPR-associated protein n=1 Tax=Pseudoalteromonas sp. T1lg65 TaxID=2077101 RepID=UPI003F7990BE